MRRVLALALAIVLVPACSRGSDDGGALRLELDGRATITGLDGGARDVDGGGHDLEAGDRVRVTDGSAVLELPGEPEVLLRAGSEVRAAGAPEILDGVVVVLGDIRFTAGDVDVRLTDDAAARVRRALGITVGLYRGAADVRSAGRPFAGGLDALRQVTIPATGLLPRHAVPLVYDTAAPDAWDRRFLGDAITLGVDLDRLARGFTAQLGPRARVDASMLREVLPPLAEEPAFGDALVEDVDDRSPGESLVGAAIAVESDRGDLAARWTSVFEFRADGAPWGLVALDQAVRRDALQSRLNDAFDRSPLLFAAGGSSTASTTPATTTTTTTTVPGAPTSTTTTTEPEDPDDPLPIPLPPLPDDPAPEEPDPDEPGAEDPADLIEELIEDLLP